MFHVSSYMIIGIDASRAFVKNKTGIEEYSYQVIKHLRDFLQGDEVILYLDPRVNRKEYIDFKLPEKWEAKFLWAPMFWTQARLSLEMLFRAPDILFVPAHTVPFVHPKNTFVTIHGLEYEFCPKAYSFFERLYMRWSIRNSCRWAKKIIAVSENTKKDLMKLYGVPERKIEVIYEGVSNFKLATPPLLPKAKAYQISNQFQNNNFKNTKYEILDTKYLLFIGRLEERKNICGIIEAFDILKEKYNLPHKLVLVGEFGYGEDHIKYQIENSKYKEDIILPGYVSGEDKFELMKKADVFLFPTFYEGFGLPILEAQSIGTPVVTSKISSMPEVALLRQGFGGQAGDSAVLVDPKDTNAIAEAVHKVLSDKNFRDDIIEKGLENVKRFSWEKCASSIAKMLIVVNDKNE